MRALFGLCLLFFLSSAAVLELDDYVPEQITIHLTSKPHDVIVSFYTTQNKTNTVALVYTSTSELGSEAQENNQLESLTEEPPPPIARPPNMLLQQQVEQEPPPPIPRPGTVQAVEDQQPPPPIARPANMLLQQQVEQPPPPVPRPANMQSSSPLYVSPLSNSRGTSMYSSARSSDYSQQPQILTQASFGTQYGQQQARTPSRSKVAAVSYSYNDEDDDIWG